MKERRLANVLAFLWTEWSGRQWLQESFSHTWFLRNSWLWLQNLRITTTNQTTRTRVLWHAFFSIPPVWRRRGSAPAASGTGPARWPVSGSCSGRPSPGCDGTLPAGTESHAPRPAAALGRQQCHLAAWTPPPGCRPEEEDEELLGGC